MKARKAGRSKKKKINARGGSPAFSVFNLPSGPQLHTCFFISVIVPSFALEFPIISVRLIAFLAWRYGRFLFCILYVGFRQSEELTM
jgi:hypothetical protein